MLIQGIITATGIPKDVNGYATKGGVMLSSIVHLYLGV